MQTLGNMPFEKIGPFHYIVRLPVPPKPVSQAAHEEAVLAEADAIRASRAVVVNNP